MLCQALWVSGADYRVGPGQPLLDPNQVPWESLHAGDRVLIHARPEPYRCKLVLCCRGTAERPIRIEGVKDGQGRRPVLDGNGATTRKQVNFWGEERAVIKIGGANRPADTVPEHVVVSGLEVRGGRQPNVFAGRNGRSRYAKNAAAIFVEKGRQLLIEDCVIHDSGNGIITSPATRDLTVRGCHIFDNGVEGSLYEHNVYTTGIRMTFEFNHIGPLRSGCPGNNFKDRSAGLRFRCNWVAGGNRCLDLVDADAPEIINDPLYAETMVWGNVLLKSAPASNNQVIHFGGDSGELKRYRRGVLYLWNNTVVSLRPGNTVLVRPSHRGCHIECRNNIVFVAPRDGRLCILAEPAGLDIAHNWFSTGWVPLVGGGPAPTADIVTGEDPGFVDWRGGDLRLRPDSSARGRAVALSLPGDFGAGMLRWQYAPHLGHAERSTGRSLGAFE
jgi:hypothetical protein